MTCAICGKAQSEHHTYQEAPVTPPPSTGKPPLPAGYDRMIYVEATYGQVLPPINTSGWTPTTLLCISFTANANPVPPAMGTVSIAPITPAPSCERKVCISQVAGSFAEPYPYSRHGQDCATQFQTGGTSRTNCILVAGTRYFINYSWTELSRDGKGDARVQVNWPK